MVSVSRGVEEPSCFLVVVAESVESIEKSLEAAAHLPHLPYHSTPKEGPPETGRKGVVLAERVFQIEQIQRVERSAAPRIRANICLLTIVVITSIISLQQKPGGGP